jgi:hypothetical protein
LAVLYGTCDGRLVAKDGSHMEKGDQCQQQRHRLC